MLATAWFPFEIYKPVHKGVYQVLLYTHSYVVFYSYWDGKKFCLVSTKNESLNTKEATHTQIVKWRGVSLY